MDRETLKKEAEELYPLPDSRYIHTGRGSVMDCGSKSRALAVTFVRRADYMNSMAHGRKEVAIAMRRLMRSLDIEDHVHDFESAADEARDLLREMNMPAIYEFNEDTVDRADALGLKPLFNRQERNEHIVIHAFTTPLTEERAKSIASHFKMEAAEPKNDALWVLSDDDDDMYISIFEGRDGTTMEFGPGRLVEMLEFMESNPEPVKP